MRRLQPWVLNGREVQASKPLALEIEGGEDQLQALYARLNAHQVRIDRVTDHVMSRRVSVFDPDGNRLEIFCDRLPGEAKQWLHDHARQRLESNVGSSRRRCHDVCGKRPATAPSRLGADSQCHAGQGTSEDRADQEEPHVNLPCAF